MRFRVALVYRKQFIHRGDAEKSKGLKRPGPTDAKSAKEIQGIQFPFSFATFASFAVQFLWLNADC